MGNRDHSRMRECGSTNIKPRSIERGFIYSSIARFGIAYTALLSPVSLLPVFLVSTNSNGSLATGRGPRGRGVRRRGASSSTGAMNAAGVATVSINTNGSLGASSRLRRRAGLGVECIDEASSI